MLRADNELTIKWALFPRKPCANSLPQKAQMFAWTQWGPEDKAGGLGSGWLIDSIVRCGTRMAPLDGQSSVTWVNGSGSGNNTVNVATCIC